MGVEGQFLEQLKRPDLTDDEITAILRDPEARRFHAVRLGLARHRNTPRPDALALVETLFWRDLAHLSADSRVHAEVRRAADTELLRRLPEMAVAERIDLARNAGRGALLVLRHDPDPRVAAACLENRFATEPDVIQAALQPGAASASLEAIAGHSRWSLRRGVRDALLRNPRLPPASAEALLDRLTDPELERLRSRTDGPPGVRRIAQRILARRLRAV
ncbi:MAG TPA: hypothetical protein VGQ75_10680 [Thermoanaerobaculia bacterium]|jgi:hypothetical protein|nr:hypothetical protein [Thermoanaerobaculia bacterium]HEV8608566.1 hypothetical protein [Thermoanaerobaculia bacterium]